MSFIPWIPVVITILEIVKEERGLITFKPLSLC